MVPHLNTVLPAYSRCIGASASREKAVTAGAGAGRSTCLAREIPAERRMVGDRTAEAHTGGEETGCTCRKGTSHMLNPNTC